MRLGVGGVVGELDAARLAAPAGQHLRLDDDLAAELLGGGARLLRGRREPAVGDGDAEAPEELLALVLVEIHGGGASRRRVASAVRSSATTQITWPVLDRLARRDGELGDDARAMRRTSFSIFIASTMQIT